MKNLNVKKAKQQIRLDDSPDSPVFTLDLTDESIARMAPTLAGVFVVYSQLADSIKPGEPIDEVVAVKIASVYEKIISTMLGEDAYVAIYQYINDLVTPEGLDVEQVGKTVLPSHLTGIMAPIVSYLMDEFYDVITANRNAAVIKYLQGHDGPAAL